MFERALADPAVGRRGSGEATQIKVDLGEVILGDITRTYSKTAEKTSALGNLEDIQRSMQAVASVGASSAALQGEAWGNASSAFAPHTCANPSFAGTPLYGGQPSEG